MIMRVAVGGIHIESSTFSPIRTRLRDFRVLRDSELNAAPEFAFLQDYPFTWLPTLHARALPGGPVTLETYRQLKDEHLTRLRAALPLDGVYLAMHGAMYVDGLEDAEGDWISATREVVGPDAFISASYDLHGNLSQRIIKALDMLSAYRTAPHIDVPETRQRAVNLLQQALETQVRPRLAWVPVPVLVPGERSSTEDEPARSLYALLPGIDAVPGILDASLLVGYVWADEPRTTASVVLTGTDAIALEREARRLAGRYWDAREQFSFGVTTGSLEECFTLAARAVPEDETLAIIADSGDNPTAGGVGDRAEALAILCAQQIPGALLAGIADEPATSRCYEAGAGALVELSVGATLDPQGSQPLKLAARVEFLVSAADPAERQAVIRLQDPAQATVVLTARRRPFHNLQDFLDLQLDLADYRVLVVKSGYLSPQLAPLASPSLLALSAGAVDQFIERLRYDRWLRPRYPLDRDFVWEPHVIWSGQH
jgi:microcystin degradation protein MlrC